MSKRLLRDFLRAHVSLLATSENKRALRKVRRWFGGTS